MTQILVSILSFLLGVFFRAISPPTIGYFRQRLAVWASRRKWKLGTKHGLGGEWTHAWYAKGSSVWPDENECEVTICSFRNRFAGVYLYADKQWLVTGKIGDDRIILGEWTDLSPSGYRGNWLGKLDLNGMQITGWYLGTSNREPAIGVGEWHWWRKGSPRPDLPKVLIQRASGPRAPR